MRSIFKYTISISPRELLVLPKGSTILSTENQRESLVIWALVDKSEEEDEEYAIHVVGTGAEIAPNFDLGTFLGTVLFEQGTWVFHVFYKKN